MADEIILVQREDGTLEKCTRSWKEPYATIELMTKEDYDTFKRLVELGCNKEWIDPQVELPADPKQLVLVLVSGRYNNITFKHAYELANYIPGEGWILEEYPSWENPQISHWTLLPEMPDALRDEQRSDQPGGAKMDAEEPRQ